MAILLKEAHKRGDYILLTTNKDFEGVKTHNPPFLYFMKSTDTKPINAINGAWLVIMDQKKVETFDAEGKEWLPFADFS